ncbi:MAG: lipoyl(octanoyl) transferase LipB [Myxococcota bacterium]
MGHGVPYAQGMQCMQQTIRQVQQVMQKEQRAQGHLLLLQHKPVITHTRSGGKKHIILPASQLAKAGIELVQTDRGGDVMFHGPGQLIGYPIIPISRGRNFVAIGRYLHALQEALLAVCKSVGVPHCTRIPGKTGIWVCSPGKPSAKLAAVGVGVNAQGISRHGFALNVSADLQLIERCIVPCGLAGTTLTNLHDQLQHINKPLPSLSQLCKKIASSIGKHLDLDVHWSAS